jgi:hypothetical protein
MGKRFANVPPRPARLARGNLMFAVRSRWWTSAAGSGPDRVVLRTQAAGAVPSGRRVEPGDAPVPAASRAPDTTRLDG